MANVPIPELIRVMSKLRALLKEHLLHFLGLAGLIFVLNAWGGEDAYRAETEISVGAADIQRLIDSWSSQYARAPAEIEIRAMVEDYVKEEILTREALRLGLDRDDTIIRRRLAQKITFLSDDAIAIEEPTDDELKAYLAAHPDRFTDPARLSFRHIFLSPDRRRGTAEADAKALLARLEAEPSLREDWRAQGDPFMLAQDYIGREAREIDKLFGPGFAAALEGVPVGGWHGPVASALGLHLVEVLGREAGGRLDFALIRNDVRDAFLADARATANEAFYQRLRARYRVSIAPLPTLLEDKGAAEPAGETP